MFIFSIILKLKFIKSCFWNGEGKDSEYKHISELTEDDFLNVKELDQDYDYDQEYDYDETRNVKIHNFTDKFLI